MEESEQQCQKQVIVGGVSRFCRRKKTKQYRLVKLSEEVEEKWLCGIHASWWTRARGIYKSVSLIK